MNVTVDYTTRYADGREEKGRRTFELSQLFINSMKWHLCNSCIDSDATQQLGKFFGVLVSQFVKRTCMSPPEVETMLRAMDFLEPNEKITCVSYAS